jgi:hypothetical protein
MIVWLLRKRRSLKAGIRRFAGKMLQECRYAQRSTPIYRGPAPLAQKAIASA